MRICVALTSLLLLATAGARAELEISGYLGAAATADSDVQLGEPGVRDLNFEGVSWRGDAFSEPIYYGFRFVYWWGMRADWGAGVEFIHAKMYAGLDREVLVTGVRDGQPVDTREPLRSTFAGLSFSHGHNFITANVMRRWRGLWQENLLLARLTPHAGGGAGVAMPHVEAAIDGRITDEFQFGFGLQGLVGLDVLMIERLSALVEYKLTYARIDAELTGGAELRVRPWTHHVTFGLSYGVF